MMHSSHEDIELCSIESNRTLYKNNQKIRKSSGTVRRDKIELVRLSSVRFENLFKFDTFNVLIALNLLKAFVSLTFFLYILSYYKLKI